MSVDQIYASRMHKETKRSAAWLPNAQFKIGDFGPVNGAVFERHGSLSDEELGQLKLRNGASIAAYDISIDVNRKITAGASVDGSAEVAKGKALLELSFNAENGISFAAPEVSLVEIEDLKVLGDILRARLERGEWDIDHCVITELVTTKKATILISTQKGAKVGFEVEANAPINAGLLASLDASTSMVFIEGVKNRFVGEGPLTPLFRLAQLRKKWFSDPKIDYRGPGEDPELIDLDGDHLLAVY